MIRTLALLALLLAAPAYAATVLSVGDGDTMRVNDAGRAITVRLACIDAPEARQAPYGAAARQRLTALAPVGSTVTLRPQTIDRYGRTVAEVIADGRNVGLTLVRDGQAFAYRQYLARCDRSAYITAEEHAQSARVGVWAVPGGVQRPWLYRSGGRLTCAALGSRSRAQEALQQGHTYLDPDRDGVACEGLR
jgi:endonuclease YncB( thermonuclease family)